MKRPDIFIVEDDALLAWALGAQLEDLGYEVAGSASTAPEAVEAVLRLGPALVLMDVRLAQDTSGFDAAHAIRESSHVPILFCTAYADLPGVADEVRRIRNVRLVGKPVDGRLLRRLLDELLLVPARDERVGAGHSSGAFLSS
jgi:CheY-like chemotaxis protein